MRGLSHLPTYPLDVVSGRKMAEIDRIAIDTCGIPGLQLMEQAGRGVAEGLLASIPQERLNQTAILCGKGNNGGDGFVIARHLAKNGYKPLVALVGSISDLRGDALTVCRRMQDSGIPLWECPSDDRLESFFTKTNRTKVWIDALLGTGTRGAPRGTIAKAIQCINQRSKGTHTVSVDIPSGVNADTGQVEGAAIEADDVYTMGLPKIGNLAPPGMDYGNQLIVLDIGFPRELLSVPDSTSRLLTAREVNSWLPKRKKSAHKGMQGHALIIAGSRGMTGAALMSAKAALHAGAGLVTAACPKSLFPIYASGVWEMMTLPVCETEEGSFSEKSFYELFPESSPWKSVVIGPGLGRNPSTMELVRKIVREVPLPIAIDGDGLFAVSKEDLKERRWDWAATPHPGEMARLFETTTTDIQADRISYAKRLSDSSMGVSVLKGANTVVACANEKTYINPTGTPAMASGGMGDVLTGVVGAFLANGLTVQQAAACGVFLHGLSAQITEWENHAEAVTATQVISNLQNALYRTRMWAERDSTSLS